MASSSSTTFRINTPSTMAAAVAAKQSSQHNTPASSTPSKPSPTAGRKITLKVTSSSKPRPPAVPTISTPENALPTSSPSTISLQPTTATQDLLKRVGATSTMAKMQGSPEWEAARQQVIKSMGGAYDSFSISKPSTDSLTPPLSTNGGATSASSNSGGLNGSFNHNVETPPARRGRGRPIKALVGSNGSNTRPRGRPRLGKGSGGSRPGKRKRSASDASSSSSSSEAYTPVPSTTRSGRSVTKPVNFNPAAPTQQSPTTATPGSLASPHTAIAPQRRRRGGGLATTKRFFAGAPADSILCSKCSRAHSPQSNMIVFCDGCNSPWHQWCHDPLISREAVERPEKEWFCTFCASKREFARVPLGVRVAKGDLTEREQRTYLTALPHETLVTLLLHAVREQPATRVFDPDTRRRVKDRAKGHAPPGAPVKPDPLYPDFDNEEGEPPATYPRPGRGPIPPRPTTDAADMAMLVDPRNQVFSHLVRGGDGEGLRRVGGDGGAEQREALAQQRESQTREVGVDNGAGDADMLDGKRGEAHPPLDGV